MSGLLILYFFYYSILFELLKIVNHRFPDKGIFLQFFSICLFEFVKTKGFLGFSYGVNGYNQYRNIYLIQIADIFGVWAISGVLNFSSVLVFLFLKDYFNSKKNDKKHVKHFISTETKIAFGIEMSVLVVFYIYGFSKVTKIENRDNHLEKIKVCAIQHNTDPWINGLKAYKKDFEVLGSLTDQALEMDSSIDLVVWPETAIVPSINKAWYERKDPSRTEYVETLLNYINEKQSCFIIGNFNSDFANNRDYNSAFLFRPKENVIPPDPEVYSKIHLVPFSETFPFYEKIPHLSNFLLGDDTHLWTSGLERKVFKLKAFSFSVPICFEDSFGNECKKFYKEGARAFINVTNDAWALSRKCQLQHLQNGVFRSVENHIPTVRSAVSGETCYISSCGKINDRCRPFEQGYIICEVPVIIATE